MVFPLPPLTFSCRICTWKKTYPHEVSDARIPGLTHFAHCPRCGSAVESRRANPLDILSARIGHALRKRG